MAGYGKDRLYIGKQQRYSAGSLEGVKDSGGFYSIGRSRCDELGGSISSAIGRSINSDGEGISYRMQNSAYRYPI
ncbi:hypothetical protein SAMN06269301_1715 [Geobacter sp. DSM 9736]|nr:hypothetical protein SAMN06269301_1715 [Geobacter sp. DSM 9736]